MSSYQYHGETRHLYRDLLGNCNEIGYKISIEKHCELFRADYLHPIL
jgi:hypothetical protein